MQFRFDNDISNEKDVRVGKGVEKNAAIATIYSLLKSNEQSLLQCIVTYSMILCFGWIEATMQPMQTMTADSFAHILYLVPSSFFYRTVYFALRLVSKDTEKEIELIKSWNVFNFTFQKWFVICWLVRFCSLNSVKTLLSVSNEVVVISETLITRTFCWWRLHLSFHCLL